MNDEETRDSLLLEAIYDRPDGDILNIVQAARELPGNLYDRLSKAYHEITRGPLTEAEANSMIGLVEKPPIECSPGKRYLVVYQLPGQKYAREAVMDFLGVNALLNKWGFSARPVAGTQDLDPSWILEVHEVPKTTECYVNRRH